MTVFPGDWALDCFRKPEPVSVVINTGDCDRIYELYLRHGVKFTEPPGKFLGVQAVLKDLYGNGYALVQAR